MSRTKHQSKKGKSKCNCGHYEPCPILSRYDTMEENSILLKFKKRYFELRYGISEED